MKIEIIELLNLVHDNKAPKKILYKYCEYEFSPEINDYKNKNSLELFNYLFSNEEQALFLEVEIIEEKPMKIELLTLNQSKQLVHENKYYSTRVADRILIEKIQELSKTVNYLLEKSDKDE